MKSHSTPHLTLARRNLVIAVAALLTPFAIGCASPGVPRPPSLHLPELVSNLTADRIGDDVQIHWTTPSRTTDDLELKGALTAEICRETITPASQSLSASSANCIAIKRFPVSPGPRHATDPLTAPLTNDPPMLLAYRIQIFNANGHSAGLSSRAFTAAGIAPPPVEHLHATPIRAGAQLEWQSQPTHYTVELDRLLVPRPTPPSATPKPAAKQSLNLAQPAPTEVHLQVDNQPTDPGGTLDRNALNGETYRYTAQRVHKISLAGHAIELRSVASPTITIVMRDTFPPARPYGLVAIADGTPSTSQPSQTPAHSIDLSWEPVMDQDLTGYIVYRQDVTSSGALSGPAARLTPTPIPSPAFRDQTAVTGHTYAYRVTAIDTTGNESAPSADVQETLREQ